MINLNVLSSVKSTFGAVTETMQAVETSASMLNAEVKQMKQQQEFRHQAESVTNKYVAQAEALISAKQRMQEAGLSEDVVNQCINEINSNFTK